MEPLLVKTAHALPRRVRLEIPALVGDEECSKRVAEALVQLPGVDRVAVRVGIGSVVLESDAAEIDANEIATEAKKIVSRDLGPEAVKRSAEPPHYGGPTRVARALAHAVAGINADVRDALGGHADLGTVLPFVFATAGVVEVAVTRRVPVPPWFNLLWWSLRSFMTFNEKAVVQEAKATRIRPRPRSSGRRAQREAGSGRSRSRRRSSES